MNTNALARFIRLSTPSQAEARVDGCVYPEHPYETVLELDYHISYVRDEIEHYEYLEDDEAVAALEKELAAVVGFLELLENHPAVQAVYADRDALEGAA